MRKYLLLSALIAAAGLFAACQRQSGPVIIECGGPAQFACPDGMFCDLGETCGGLDSVGQCRIQPPNCPNEDRPVCGCNGETFASPCYAHATGTSINYEGPCMRRKPPVSRQETKMEFPSTGSVRTGDVEGAGDVIRDGETETSTAPHEFELE